ncbi:RNA polymerase [Lentithecium fluviatile CBS 122367]|uniref:DNA-directed RNA polymerases I, II, and III subunit RPABC3 n=1 Tax=Lentithecium fluviatile CBS 122367 TaxID=1168545 RepID=A0A6G1JDJ3_9PLEO|nr:RNA polymerase [Lentithecium fluviatile CBS 122367]
MSDATKFDETFNITAVDNSKYDRVSRLSGTSTDNSITITLDINHELFPVQQGETLNIALATTLKLDGTKDDEKMGWREVAKGAEQSLADLYDYVCYGKVYRVTEDNEGADVKVYLSFGGLLLVLHGPYRKLTTLKVEQMYLLVKR